MKRQWFDLNGSDIPWAGYVTPIKTGIVIFIPYSINQEENERFAKKFHIGAVDNPHNLEIKELE